MMLRKARNDDTDFILELRNEEYVRAASISTGIISRDAHEKWFSQKMSDHNSLILIAEDDGQRIGQIRFDKIPGKPCAEVDVSVVKERRFGGVGTEIIREGSRIALECMEVSALISRIKPENMASARAFEKSGFKKNGMVDCKGQKCVEMILERN